MNRIKENFSIKLLAVFVAIMIWSYAMNSIDPQSRKELRNIPVTYLNQSSLMDQDLMVVEPKDPMINVKLNGRRQILNNVTARDIIAEIDLTGYGEGTQRVHLNMTAPSGTSFDSSTDRTILVKIEKRVKRSLNIEVQREGELPSGNIVIGNIDIDPKTIVIEGPSSKVNSIQSATVPLDISKLNQDTKLTAPITLINYDGQVVSGLKFDKEFANIAVAINMQKEVPVKIKTINDLPENMKLLSKSVVPNKVTLVGNNDALNRIQEVLTEDIDLSTIEDSKTIGVQLNLPKGVALFDKNKEIVVAFAVDKIETKDVMIPIENIKIEGLSSNQELVWKNSKEKIGVRIEGYSSELKKITDKDIQLKVDIGPDMKELVTLDIQAILKNDAKIKSIKAGSVQATIVEK